MSRGGWLSSEPGRVVWSAGDAPIAAPPAPPASAPIVLGAKKRAKKPIAAPGAGFSIIQDTAEPSAEHDAPSALFHPHIYRGGERVYLPVVRQSLETGDYSAPGLDRLFLLERKTIGDLLKTCFGVHGNSVGEGVPEMERFRAELERGRAVLAAGGRFAIVVEGVPQDIFDAAEEPGRRFDPMAIMTLLHSFWADYGAPTLWMVSREGAEHFVGSVLLRAWEQAQIGGAGEKKAVKRGLAEHLPWCGTVAKAGST